MGQKIYIRQFKDNDLHSIAFKDSQIFVHQIHSLKNFLLVGNVFRSINVIQYQQDYRKGQHICCMWRVRAKLSDPSTSQRLLAANEEGLE